MTGQENAECWRREIFNQSDMAKRCFWSDCIEDEIKNQLDLSHPCTAVLIVLISPARRMILERM
jgi:hypothetical protein